VIFATASVVESVAADGRLRALLLNNHCHPQLRRARQLLEAHGPIRMRAMRASVTTTLSQRCCTKMAIISAQHIGKSE